MAKILVVEDDALVRALTVDLLSELGHTTQDASSAAQGTTMLADKSIEAAVVDMGLPDIKEGDDFVLALRRAHPELPILIASGRTQSELQQRYSNVARVGVVGKPYTLDALRDALARIGVTSSK